jgi:hypothetical protein
LCAVVGFFYPQGRLQLRSVTAHYQIVQGVHIRCCFFPSSSQVTLQPQLWLISSSSNKVGQFLRFVHCPQSHEISSVICHHTTLGGWLFTPSLLSEFVPCPTPPGRVQILTPTPTHQGWVSITPCLPMLTVVMIFTVYVIQFNWEWV